MSTPPQELKQLRAARGYSKSSITRLYNFVNNGEDVELTPLTTLQSKRTRIVELFAEYEGYNKQILVFDDADPEDVADCEAKYYHILTVLNEAIKTKSSPTSEAAASCHNFKARLPTVQVEIFSDKYDATMGPVKLEGPTLGHKHRNYNQIIKESISNQTTDALKDIDFNEDDVNNLVKVDMACVNRNVDYILGILKGNDMLYVSRAIARSPWLITDSIYAHIINPEYLHSHLLPNMMAKAGNKLLLHIRLNLRDETRVESFFNYYEHLDLKTALKWLPHCSTACMEVNVKKYPDGIKPHLLKRLCEKSHSILEILVRSNAKQGHNLCHEFKETMFLLTTHTDFYLDLIETRDTYEYPQFNAKCTKFLMKECSERIHQKFYKYVNKIHIQTFVKFLDGNIVRKFLLTQAMEETIAFDNWMHLNNLQHFFKIMPQEDRINFIRDIFVNKSFTLEKEGSESRDITEDADEVNTKIDEKSGMARIYKLANDYKTAELLSWDKCLPFDIALTEVKEKMKCNTDEYSRNNTLESLTRIVNRDMRHLETLLQYYNDNHLKDSGSSKLRFVSNLFEQPTNVLSYDSKCWSQLTNILNTVNLDIDESKCNSYHGDQIWVKTIIVHEVINKKLVPENIIKRFHFSTLKEYQKKANSEERKLLFEYLYSYLVTKIEQKENIAEDKFYGYVGLIRSMLNLLNDWHKNLADNPYVLDKIKKLIKLKQDYSSKIDLAWIYNVNKSWRKCMFEESIILCESERVCVNALKHDASLLSRNEELLAAMRSNDTVSLRQLFSKVKVYWADSFAYEWTQSYREKLAQPLVHKAIVRGLSFLLPQRELIDIINAYKPEDANINWENNVEILINLRKNIAKNMHFARPQPTPDDILQYAKGDYLQFALPSLNAIFYNLSANRCQELIPKLLNSPVSLQKHVIRLAFTKMQSEDLQRIFCDHWKTIKNLSIRAVLFKLTYGLLCKEKNPAKIDNIWRLLKVFIDELSFEEDKTIYEHLGQVQKVPLSVRHFYVMRSYTFLKALLPKSDIDKSKYEQTLESLILEMTNLMESMEPEFVAKILQEYFAAVYTQKKTEGFVHQGLIPLMASYLFCAATEEVQAERYDQVLLPLLKHTVAVWADTDKNDIVKTNLRKLLLLLRQKLKYDEDKYKIIPTAMFSAIQKELEQSLDRNVAYLMLTEWKLTTAFAKVINDTKDTVDRSNSVEGDTKWAALCSKAAPLFGKMCLEFLREDIKTFFPCIDEYFSKALCTFFDGLINSDDQIQILKNMLTEDLTQSYLVAIRALLHCWGCKEDMKLELHKTILSHPSLEVKMHFYHKNKDYRYKDLHARFS